MRHVIVLFVIPLGIALGFVPFANPDSLAIYPLWHNRNFSSTPCTLDVLQPKIRFVLGNDDSLTQGGRCQILAIDIGL